MAKHLLFVMIICRHSRCMAKLLIQKANNSAQPLRLSINQYTNIKKEAKAWGLIPLEFTTTLRWQILKDLWVKGDLWAFDGAPYLQKDGSAHNADRGFDLNAGIEFRITKTVESSGCR